MTATPIPADRPARQRVRLVAAALAGTPSLLLAIVSVWWALDGMRGGGLWPPVAQTLAEAAATGDTGEVVWQIQTGADPNARATVRAGMVTKSTVSLTPLEAAVRGRNAEIVRLLIDRGAVIDGRAVTSLRCLNVALGGDAQIDDALAHGESPLPACDTASPAP